MINSKGYRLGRTISKSHKNNSLLLNLNFWVLKIVFSKLPPLLFVIMHTPTTGVRQLLVRVGHHLTLLIWKVCNFAVLSLVDRRSCRDLNAYSVFQQIITTSCVYIWLSVPLEPLKDTLRWEWLDCISILKLIWWVTWMKSYSPDKLGTG